jgi:hypothetical protein
MGIERRTAFAVAVLCTAGTCILALASKPLGGMAHAQAGPQPQVLVATTGNDSELRKTVKIKKRKGPGRVVMSMGPDVLPSLSSGDRLFTTAELEVTTDCAQQDNGCVGSPYKYNPSFSARLVLAGSGTATGGEGTLEIGAQRRKCSQRDFGHHCVIVFAGSSLDVDGQLPCAPGSCYLNLVVESHKRRAKKGNRLLIGENEPDGTVAGDKSRINVTRFSPGNQPAIPSTVTTTPLATSIPVAKGQGVVIYSQELTGLERNEQLRVASGMTSNVTQLDYAALVRSRLILAPDPTATDPGKEVKELTEPKGEISEANGFNCTQRRPICRSTKVGVIRMRRTAEDESGDPIPLYVNVVVDTAKPGATPAAGDTVLIDPVNGVLDVTRYPADLRG